MYNQSALLALADIYSYGKFGIKQDYSKAIKYLEILCDLNNPDGLNSLGLMYEFGTGVPRNYEKARKLFELASKQDGSASFVNLGIIYLYGRGCPKDYPRAKYYFEKSAELNYSEAFFLLGIMYFKGMGVDQNYEISIKYFEKAAELQNITALIRLTICYLQGEGVDKNYEKAKKYIEFPVRQNNSTALLVLAIMYLKGYGFDKDYEKARKYLELSALQNNTLALYTIAGMYSSGYYCDSDINKAIQYLEKCISICSTLGSTNSSFYIDFEDNTKYYNSYNDLGLIYITVFNDVDKGEKYIKIAALNEYPFAQNNFGLLNQLYLNNKSDPEYMYTRSSENNLALADFNLGNLKEVKGEIEESIKFYIKASNNEDAPFLFHGDEYEDDRLIISQTFIICYTNLKLTEYYFSKGEYDESKKFFIKSFAKIKIDKNDDDFDHIYQFRFIWKSSKNMFSYLKSFILNFPKFYLLNQPNLNNDLINDLKLNNENDSSELINSRLKDEKILVLLNKNYAKKEEKFDDYKKDEFENDIIDDDKYIFNDPGKLFDFVIENKNIKSAFINEIRGLIQVMKKILFSPPYLILFGRINIERKKPKTSINQSPNEINQIFYEGFEDA